MGIVYISVLLFCVKPSEEKNEAIIQKNCVNKFYER